MNSLSLHYTLPCGCQLNMMASSEEGTPLLKALDTSAQHLHWWLEDRIARHDCRLVSEANPSGKGPPIVRRTDAQLAAVDEESAFLTRMGMTEEDLQRIHRNQRRAKRLELGAEYAEAITTKGTTT